LLQTRTRLFRFAAVFRSKNWETLNERETLRVFGLAEFRICECFSGGVKAAALRKTR